MSLYSIFVFLHVVGALGLFAGIALEQVSLTKLRRAATAAQAREWAALLGGLRRSDGPSGLLILISGFYMVAVRWAWQPWIGLALLGMVGMAFLGIAVTGRRAAAISRSLTTDAEGSLAPAIRRQIHDRALRISASVRAALGVAIVFNMTIKPDVLVASTAMGIAVVVGLLSGPPMRWRSEHGRVPPHNEPVASTRPEAPPVRSR